jgi:gamma-glutamyl:cysteine ligase YbdK (ATP-grasp superfamily)
LLKSEREKLREGKYDGALDKLDQLYTDLEAKARELQDSKALEELQRLGERRRELEQRLGRDDQPGTTAERELDELTADTEELMHEMETKGQPPAPY